jgi:hypothetical protein
MATVAPFNKFVPPRINTSDAVKTIWDSLGESLDKFYLMRNQILVVKFSPDKVGSLYRANSSKKEDVWQGKVGLVVKMGKIAFVDDARTQFYGEGCEVGQWVMYRSSDGYDVEITPNGWSGDHIPCRVLEEVHIKGILDEPDLVY